VRHAHVRRRSLRRVLFLRRSPVVAVGDLGAGVFGRRVPPGAHEPPLSMRASLVGRVLTVLYLCTTAPLTSGCKSRDSVDQSEVYCKVTTFSGLAPDTMRCYSSMSKCESFRSDTIDEIKDGPCRQYASRSWHCCSYAALNNPYPDPRTIFLCFVSASHCRESRRRFEQTKRGALPKLSRCKAVSSAYCSGIGDCLPSRKACETQHSPGQPQRGTCQELVSR
jgi:hypothetical protein